jgi:hypothetical protein
MTGVIMSDPSSVAPKGRRVEAKQSLIRGPEIAAACSAGLAMTSAQIMCDRALASAFCCWKQKQTGRGTIPKSFISTIDKKAQEHIIAVSFAALRAVHGGHNGQRGLGWFGTVL